MRRSASEVIKELQMRVTRLEKSAHQSKKLLVDIRVTQRTEEVSSSGWDKEQMSVSELVEALGDLDHAYTDYQTRGEYYTLAGFGDYSGDLYEYRIKRIDLLDALVNIHFAKVLD